MKRIKTHKRNKINYARFYIEDIIDRNMNADFNCLHGSIIGVTMALIFIGTLFL